MRAFLALSLVAVFGCGSNTPNFDSPDGSADTDGSGDEQPIFPNKDGGNGEGGNCVKCSGDLHSVLNCNDQVIQTCPADQGCGANGQCVPACDSASINQSSIGCDYFAIPADGWSNIPEFNPGTSDGSCFAAFVTNNWGSDIKVSLTFNGQTIDGTTHAYLPKGSGNAITYQLVPSSGIPANQMAIVFLAQYGGAASFKSLCPNGVSPAITNVDVGVHGTGRGHAIRLQTTAPAVVYDIYPYGGALSYTASATLLLPTSVWDTNYVGVSAWHGFGTGYSRPMNIAFVARDPGTVVTISPTAAIVSRTTGTFGTVAGTPKGTPIKYNMNAGEVLQLVQMEDLSGSPIQSNNPIGVWGGHYCMNIPDTAGACDAAHFEIPPVKALGFEYAAVAHRPRSGGDNPPWRILGVVKGTNLTYDPPVSGAPSALTDGQLVEFDSDHPFVVKSQDKDHPFYLAGHMTGASQGGGGSMGDPETVNVVPPEQYLSRYIFFTDPTYAETNLVLVRKKDAAGFHDVKLDCMSGNVPGWQALGTSGNYQWARVDVQVGHQAVGGCDNGRHEMHSDAPFGITVWGWDTTVSYAYPAGASVRPINQVIVPPDPR